MILPQLYVQSNENLEIIKVSKINQWLIYLYVWLKEYPTSRLRINFNKSNEFNIGFFTGHEVPGWQTYCDSKRKGNWAARGKHTIILIC